ncbi:hypothetical protein R5R35_000128 [Gryllus longicercus]|uniref:Uncharacterized protein n=1 Tax=Gryllus longicercus TaxID=2509291 RepID=A0AAN9YXZ5_9ORTH
MSLLQLLRFAVPSRAARLLGSTPVCTGRAASTRVDLSGILPPIPTPFHEDESLALDQLEKNFQAWEKIPFRGYVVMGSNGEFPLMTAEERVGLVRRVRQLAAPDRLVLAGPACEGETPSPHTPHAHTQPLS